MTFRDFLTDNSDLPFAGRLLAMKIIAWGMVLFAEITTVVAWWLGSTFAISAISANAFAALALWGLAQGDCRKGRSMLAQGMIGQCFAFTAAFAGHSWIIDTHMAFFVICAIVTVLVDVRALLVVVVSTVIHQIVLGLAYPALVYPSTGLSENIARIILHSALFSLQSVAMMVVVRQRQMLFSENLVKLSGLTKANADADAARAEVETRLAEADELRARAEDQTRVAQEAMQHADAQQEAVRAADAAAMEAERRISAQREENARRQDAFVADLKGALELLADGDLTVRLPEQQDASYAALASNFNETMERLSQSVATALNCSEHIRTQIAEINAAAQTLSVRTEHQANALGDAATAMSQLTGTVQQAADVSRDTAASADRARAAAHQSAEVASESIRAMVKIEESSDQIARILSVIDDIAFQTNLLALNAGVEAARAGPAGRGFAVVATEVRALAQRSSDAAREINTLIESSGLQVKSGVDLVRRTVTELDRITKAVEEISGQINELASSAAVQSRAVGEVNGSVEQVDRTTQQNVAMLEESTAANRSLHEMAEELWQAMVVFQTSGRAKMASDGLRFRHAS